MDSHQYCMFNLLLEKVITSYENVHIGMYHEMLWYATDIDILRNHQGDIEILAKTLISELTLLFRKKVHIQRETNQKSRKYFKVAWGRPGYMPLK